MFPVEGDPLNSPKQESESAFRAVKSAETGDGGGGGSGSSGGSSTRISRETLSSSRTWPDLALVVFRATVSVRV
jgi:hypothetical protein